MSVLDVSRVVFSYPGSPPVLRGLSLLLERGKIAAILGPNGAGKSTFLDVCMGWRKPSAGTVLIDGVPVESLSRTERSRRIGLVPQRENVRFDFLVLDYVLLGRAPHLRPLESPGERDRWIARRALSTAGIAGLAGRSIATLSSGEYQLVLIARSLAQEPSVMLLDEPGSHLDPGHRLRIMRTLEKLSRQGISVLLTSHDPQGAAALADTVHLMKAGRFSSAGAPRSVLTPSALRAVYGVRFRVSWSRGRFSCAPDER